MKKKKIIITAIVIGIIVLLTIPKIMGTKQQTEPNKKGWAGRKITVSTYVVKPQTVQDKIISTGSIIADKDVQLCSEASGRITNIFFKDGATVTKGQLLMKINDADLQAQLSKAQASLSLAQVREKREKGLLDKGIVIQEEYEAIAHDLETAEADVQQIKAQIDKTALRAPFDGVIGIRAVEVGGYITTGAKVANLVSLKPIKIEFALPEQYSGKVAPGNSVTFTTENSAKQYQAQVSAIDPRIDNSTRTITIRAICTNADQLIVPGSLAKIEIVLRENVHALMVPSEALVPDVNGYKVFIVKDSTVAAQTVTTGIRQEKNVEILSGIKDGDAVVVSGILSIKPGATVEVKNGNKVDK